VQPVVLVYRYGIRIHSGKIFFPHSIAATSTCTRIRYESY
jgi:hypothetical protein